MIDTLAPVREKSKGILAQLGGSPVASSGRSAAALTAVRVGALVQTDDIMRRTLNAAGCKLVHPMGQNELAQWIVSHLLTATNVPAIVLFDAQTTANVPKIQKNTAPISGSRPLQLLDTRCESP